MSCNKKVCLWLRRVWKRGRRSECVCWLTCTKKIRVIIHRSFLRVFFEFFLKDFVNLKVKQFWLAEQRKIWRTRGFLAWALGSFICKASHALVLARNLFLFKENLCGPWSNWNAWPFPEQALAFTCLQYKSLKTLWEKEKLPAEFCSPFGKTFCHFYQN